MSQNFGTKYLTARESLRETLWDLGWHRWSELERAGGNRYTARLLELKRLGFVIESAEDESGDGKRYRLCTRVPSVPQAKRVKVFFNEADAVSLSVDGFATESAMEAVRGALHSFRVNKHKL